MMKRIFDSCSSLIVLIVGLPIFSLIALAIVLDSKGGVFFRQIRVGKNGEDFGLFKFRTMKPDSESLGQITVGGRDPRVTKVGYWLRRFKFDEFPQLINVLIGDMSIVGPRPEVPKYVDLYTDEQKKVLSVRPGLTDYASLEYINENELLEKSDNPNETYINEIMPAKLKLNLKYIEDKSLWVDFKLIMMTIAKLFKN
ncbi:MAG: sugar transferase [Flavobacteriales bacterium]|nr:sugar transferase [Flavobacteriales bacterium]